MSKTKMTQDELLAYKRLKAAQRKSQLLALAPRNETMKQSSAAIAYHGLFPVLDRLQERLEAGCSVLFQDGRCHLFAKNGHSIVSGDTLRKMLVELVFVE